MEKQQDSFGVLMKDQVDEYTWVSKARLLRERHQKLKTISLNKRWIMFRSMFANQATCTAWHKASGKKYVTCAPRTVELVEDQKKEDSTWRSEKSKFLFISGLGLYPKVSWDGLPEIKIDASKDNVIVNKILRKNGLTMNYEDKKTNETGAVAKSSSSYTSEDSGLGQCKISVKQLRDIKGRLSKKASSCKRRVTKKKTGSVNSVEILEESDSENSVATIPISLGILRDQLSAEVWDSDSTHFDSIDCETKKSSKEEKEPISLKKMSSWMSELPEKSESNKADCADDWKINADKGKKESPISILSIERIYPHLKVFKVRETD